MQNSRRILTSLGLLGLTAGLAGCALPGVYRIDIQQGNVITQDMVNQLKPGMNPRQVRYIMGSPLISDTFHPNRWDYIYSFQAGGSQRRQERISLMFDERGQQLVALTGDFMPGVSRDQKLLGTGTGSTMVDGQEMEEEAPAPGSLLEELQKEVDDAKPAPVPVPEPL